MERYTGIDFHTDGFTAAATAPIEDFPAEGNLETGRDKPCPEGIAGESIETHGYARRLPDGGLEIRRNRIHVADTRRLALKNKSSFFKKINEKLQSKIDKML